MLTGIEVDILEDGSLDQELGLLAELDVVVASVHSHLRMTGSWGVYAPGQRARRSMHRAWLVLERSGVQVVQFDGPVLELMSERRARSDPRLARLGELRLIRGRHRRSVARAPGRKCHPAPALTRASSPWRLDR